MVSQELADQETEIEKRCHEKKATERELQEVYQQLEQARKDVINFKSLVRGLQRELATKRNDSVMVENEVRGLKNKLDKSEGEIGWCARELANCLEEEMKWEAEADVVKRGTVAESEEERRGD